MAMLEWLSAADPGRIHTEGRMARAALEEARQQVAALFGTRPRQVIFTSGATESINAAAYGVLAGIRPGSSVVPVVEHSAVREASERWATGVLPAGVDRTGRVHPQEIDDALSRASLSPRGSNGSGRTGLVHCQMANHEVGTLQPVNELVEMCHRRGALLHVDAAAAAGRVPIAFDRSGVDLMSISAHKLGGPKGVGALLVRRGLRIDPFILGGAQERARRGGLENLPAAMGFGAVAAELSQPGALESEARRATDLLDRLRRAVAVIPGATVYGSTDEARRLPHLLCIGIDGVEAEPVLIGLDQAGVAAHSGSSCSSELLEPSPVLQAMGVDADHSLRLSVGWSTTDADVERAVGALPGVVARLRELSAGA